MHFGTAFVAQCEKHWSFPHGQGLLNTALLTAIRVNPKDHLSLKEIKMNVIPDVIVDKPKHKGAYRLRKLSHMS